ncbi:MAG: carboxypeptidase-like regulatory domain-containing protein, partial [Planctomycetaceae bacterium]|nr:carboxypeptidase-like regulatory domain-containing protein [Planctomycetaceae bacterium]
RNVPSDLPKTYFTAITVTQEGQKLANANVTLTPIDGGKWYASAITDPSGVAVLTTQGQYSGVAPGKYKILVTKREVTSAEIAIPDPNADPEGYSKALEKANATRQEFDLVDPIFVKVETTPEQIEITKGKNEKTIDVGKAVKIEIK